MRLGLLERQLRSLHGKGGDVLQRVHCALASPNQGQRVAQRYSLPCTLQHLRDRVVVLASGGFLAPVAPAASLREYISQHCDRV